MKLEFIVENKGSVEAGCLITSLVKLRGEVRWHLKTANEVLRDLGPREADAYIVFMDDADRVRDILRTLRGQNQVVGVVVDAIAEGVDEIAGMADFVVTFDPLLNQQDRFEALFLLPDLEDRSILDQAFSKAWPTYPQKPAKNGVNDWLFVTPKASQGWILEAICREIGSRHKGTWEIVYNPKVLPRARNYFFAHYWNYLDALNRNPHILEGNIFVWYTHPREIPYSEAEQLNAYKLTTQVIFTCSEFLNDWLMKGLPPEKGRLVLGGADKHLFLSHVRENGKVGLSSSFYARKNPDVLFELVKKMSHREFHLVGREWEQYEHFEEMRALPNFFYQTATYSEYPQIYAQFDVFLSLSVLEGGPIPLLEAMMCNIVPVASRTGFAPDLIQHGKNGFIFDVASNADVIAPLIDAAFAMKADIRKTVINYTWDNFSAKIRAMGDGSIR